MNPAVTRWLACIGIALLAACAGELGSFSSETTDGAPEGAAETGYVFDDDPSPTETDTGETPEGTTETPEADEDTGPRRLELKPDEPRINPQQDFSTVKPAEGADPAQRMACQRQKGQMTKTPAGFFVCVRQTGEGRKSCTAADQCKGACLARSGTCAPFTPLIGCNDVITASGGMAKVCID